MLLTDQHDQFIKQVKRVQHNYTQRYPSHLLNMLDVLSVYDLNLCLSSIRTRYFRVAFVSG